jgi:hypothetical protein
MMHLFTDIVDEFDALKAKLTSAVSKATTAVASGVAYGEDELKAAESAAFAKLETTELTLSQAFAEGAKWAAARVAVSVAQPPAATTETAAATTGTAAS